MKGKSKESEREVKIKENEREVKGNERKIKGKLSDPSPFNNILNKIIQFLLAVVGIKYSYL